MKITVGTSETQLKDNFSPNSKLIIQNLGPGKVYFDTTPSVTESSGIQLSVGVAYEFNINVAYAANVSLIADTPDTDVRIIEVGG